MNREEFEKLVRGVESRFGASSFEVLLRLWAWVFLGYSLFLAGFLLLLGAGTGLIVWSRADQSWILLLGGIGLICLSLGLLFKMLLRGATEKEGRLITASEAPELFRVLNQIRAELAAQPFHEVCLTSHVNASIHQQPILGPFGWWRNRLYIGVPLLEGMTADEVRAVLAHEFAHISKMDGRTGHFLYRLRLTWDWVFRASAQNQDQFDPAHPWSGLNRWFWPRFNSYAFVFSRTVEYRADLLAARVTSAKAMGSALMRLALLQRQLENHWPGQWKKTGQSAEPPQDLFLATWNQLREGPNHQEMETCLKEAMQCASTYFDTHPCLRERLKALSLDSENLQGDSVNFPKVQVSASTAFLGDGRTFLINEVSKMALENIREDWKSSHFRTTILSREISSAAVQPVLRPDELWERARIKLQLNLVDEAVVFLNEILKARPNHVDACFCMGKILLNKNDLAGMALLENAMIEARECSPQALEALFNFHRLQGDTLKMKETQKRLDDFEKNHEKYRRDLFNIDASDDFGAAILETAIAKKLIDLLHDLPAIEKAWLAEKRLKFAGNGQVFVLTYSTKKKSIWKKDELQEQALTRRLQKDHPLQGRVMVFPSGGMFKRIESRIQRIPGTLIFDR